MAELSESTTNEIEVELLGRGDFAGFVVVITAGSEGVYDHADVYPSDSISDEPAWRRVAMLDVAREAIERGNTPPTLE